VVVIHWNYKKTGKGETTMDIAEASIGISLSNVQTQASLSVFCKAKDMSEQSASDMLSTMVPQQAPKLTAGAIGSRMNILA
jgi:flagellar motility protein MotE (MotC chaperone)